jgi:hypothetical protein
MDRATLFIALFNLFVYSCLSTDTYYSVKGVWGEVSFDSQNDKYASHLSCDASSEAYL